MNRNDPFLWDLEEAGDTTDCLPATIHKGSGFYQHDLRTVHHSPNDLGVSIFSKRTRADPPS
jgi:hypothetical protein